MDPTAYTDEIIRRIKELRWILQIIDSTGCCCICGWDFDPRVIEQHHISGKNNSNITIPVCPTCHQILCQKQSSWPDGWTQPNNPPLKRIAFMLRGLSDITNLKSKLLRDLSVELAGDGGNNAN